MNCQEHKYYYYHLFLSLLFKTELVYIKGQIQMLDIYGVSGFSPRNKWGFLSFSFL